jgi:acetylornithine deacetylase/succinyl-diaminopimelate desuccinylase-like protein
MGTPGCPELLEDLRNDPLLLEDYFSLLRFASISSDEGCKKDLLACSAWLAERLQQIGLTVRVIDTPGAPVIFAEWKHPQTQAEAAKEIPTLLLYNHYDVQPVTPLDHWHSPPFEPVAEHGLVRARGAQDNKGQLAYTLAGLRHALQRGPLPCNIKWVIEGEEEYGSHGLFAILPSIAELIRADDCAIIDGGILSLDRPSVEIGARGIVTLTIHARGSKVDLHSGLLGGLAYNPLRALCELLGSLHNAEGRVLIPGFYDDVKDWIPEHLALLDPGPDLQSLETLFGVVATGGEQDRPLNQRNWLRPTLEINGLSGGYTGHGFKTVIPAEAVAKISCRLVPNQSPGRIGQLVAAHLKKLCPQGIELEIEVGHGGDPFVGDPEGPLTEAARAAYQELLGRPCSLALTGGSLPVCDALARAAGAGILAFGMGLPGDLIHAPNEHFSIERLELGAVLIQRLLQFYADRRVD